MYDIMGKERDRKQILGLLETLRDAASTQRKNENKKSCAGDFKKSPFLKKTKNKQEMCDIYID